MVITIEKTDLFKKWWLLENNIPVVLLRQNFKALKCIRDFFKPDTHIIFDKYDKFKCHVETSLRLSKYVSTPHGFVIETDKNVDSELGKYGNFGKIETQFYDPDTFKEYANLGTVIVKSGFGGIMESPYYSVSFTSTNLHDLLVDCFRDDSLEKVLDRYEYGRNNPIHNSTEYFSFMYDTIGGLYDTMLHENKNGKNEIVRINDSKISMIFM